jgi:hypothetical protein
MANSMKKGSVGDSRMRCDCPRLQHHDDDGTSSLGVDSDAMTRVRSIHRVMQRRASADGCGCLSTPPREPWARHRRPRA